MSKAVPTTEFAQIEAYKCSGENAPNLSMLTHENVITVRNEFLSNVCHNGPRSHESIIVVLQHMSAYIGE